MDALVQLLQPHLPASAALEIQKHCAVIAAADNGAKHDTPQLTPSQWAHRLVQPEVENIRALQQRRALRIRGAHASWQARTCAQAESKSANTCGAHERHISSGAKMQRLLQHGNTEEQTVVHEAIHIQHRIAQEAMMAASLLRSLVKCLGRWPGKTPPPAVVCAGSGVRFPSTAAALGCKGGQTSTGTDDAPMLSTP